MEAYLLPCINKEIFGMECYGCGGQRSLMLLLNGHFQDAFFMFPAIYTIIILLFFVVINIFYKFKYDFIIKIGLLILNAAIMLVSYAVKMYHFFH